MKNTRETHSYKSNLLTAQWLSITQMRLGHFKGLGCLLVNLRLHKLKIHHVLQKESPPLTPNLHMWPMKRLEEQSCLPVQNTFQTYMEIYTFLPIVLKAPSSSCSPLPRLIPCSVAKQWRRQIWALPPVSLLGHPEIKSFLPAEGCCLSIWSFHCEASNQTTCLVTCGLRVDLLGAWRNFLGWWKYFLFWLRWQLYSISICQNNELCT